MDSYTEQGLIATEKLKEIVADDTDAAIVVRAKPTAPEASYTLTIATSNMTFKKGALGSEAVDTNVGTAGVIDLTAGAYDTVGELVAYINSLADYEAYIVGALKADATGATFLAKAETQIKTLAGVPVYWDTSDINMYTLRVSGETFDYLEDGCKNEITGIIAKATCSGAIALYIYEDQTLIHSESLTTATEVNYDKNEMHISTLGKPLIVRLYGASAITYAYLKVFCKTTRLVPASKYKAD